MSPLTCTVFLFVVAIIINPFPDIHASKIYSLNVPQVVRNGTGPYDLSCIYNVKEEENGLVIKWYHNMEQIYQWIPPMPPQDTGVINGYAEYPEENLMYSNSRSIIRLKMVTIEMGGEYTCTISTFQEEDWTRTKMIVYMPETTATIHINSFNESHLNLTCVATGAEPQPMLKLYIEGVEVVNYSDEAVKSVGHGKTLSVKRSAIISNTLEPILLECEISIPHTDYKRREKIVYYPTEMLSQISNSASKYQIGIVLYIVLLLK